MPSIPIYSDFITLKIGSTSLLVTNFKSIFPNVGKNHLDHSSYQTIHDLYQRLQVYIQFKKKSLGLDTHTSISFFQNRWQKFAETSAASFIIVYPLFFSLRNIVIHLFQKDFQNIIFI